MPAGDFLTAGMFGISVRDPRAQALVPRVAQPNWWRGKLLGPWDVLEHDTIIAMIYPGGVVYVAGVPLTQHFSQLDGDND